MKANNKAKLVGLPGTANDVYATTVRSAASAMQEITKRRPVTAADTYGAMNVWRNDDGELCCELMQFCRTIDAAKPKTMTAARKWISKAFKMMRVAPPR